MTQQSLSNLVRSLGPGLLWAGAAIGVSHLVQSTRAGALFGYELIWAILIANLLKYPFFEFGPRYVAATGKSLLDGYRDQGKWAIWMFFSFTIGTMFVIQAAITFVTAGLCAYIFGSFLSDTFWWSIILLVLSIGIIAIGKYHLLDGFMKGIIIILSVSTVVAVIILLFSEKHPSVGVLESFNWNSGAHVMMLAALVGWMPAPIEISIWHSFWSLEKNKDLHQNLSLRESLFDFNVGYIVTVILAVCFLVLGANVMYGSGKVFEQGGAGFAKQVIGLYTESIGEWTFPFIAVAALATMFSTTITCLDAFPRVLNPSISYLFKTKISNTSTATFLWVTAIAAGALLIISQFLNNLKAMVDFATILAFTTSPVLAYINLRIVTGKNMPEAAKPGITLRIISWAGIIFMSGLGVFFLIKNL